MARLKLRKRESIPLSADGAVIVKLRWTADVDLDLMAFYVDKEGKTGGVYSDLYQDGSSGSLDEFPYIKLDKDAGFMAVGGNNEENLRIQRVDKRIAEIYICALNFTAASQGQTVSFAEYDAEVTVTASSSQYTLPLVSQKPGHVAVIAKIDNKGSHPTLTNVNEVYTLEEFLEKVPGADLIVEE